jgi:hypothetical protein
LGKAARFGYHSGDGVLEPVAGCTGFIDGEPYKWPEFLAA